jgi:hypothetical protein
LRRTNLEGNTHAQESNANQLSTSKNPWSFLLLLILSLTKLKIRAKWFLPGSKRVGGEREEARGMVGGWGMGGEMTRTLYAHINKRKKRKS